jgi:type I restriction enzyme R subunit
VGFTESDAEEVALDWFAQLGYSVAFGPDLLPDGPSPERSERTPWLEGRLLDALSRLNRELPRSAIEDAFKKLTRLEGPSLVAANRAVHRMAVDGVQVEYARENGGIAGARAQAFDFEDAGANDWLAVNQLTVIDGENHRRPDVVVYVNGLPLAVLELKNPADAKTNWLAAYNQLQTYKHEIPSLLGYDEALIASDGTTARIGTLTGGREWFMPWRTIEGEELAPASALELEVLIKGVFEKARFLDLIRHFVVFEDSGAGAPIKKMAGYHQFHAVNAALAETLRASGRLQGLPVAAEERSPWRSREPGTSGDKRIGVVWHTQGSGKSLTMAFYAGRVMRSREMGNPTVVVITDRNDLDDQLFGTFSRCTELLGEPPVQASDRAHLRGLLKREAGGIVFTTVQKFFPEQKDDSHSVLSERRNVVVIADEAHRSQYDFIDGFARHMHDALPNASFIGFTGTPIELSDKNTRAVFGDYISVYDIQRAVDDGATVPIFYESRLARLELSEGERPHIDPEFEEITETQEVDERERTKTKWAQLEALVGAEKRVALIARDLVEHWKGRQLGFPGKAMVVCMSRRICVELHNELVRLRPEWAGTGDADGVVKIIMTGSASDGPEWQQHIRNKPAREALALRFKNPDDPFKIAIVRDMWLTGFDVPCLSTMYIDKPMQGHTLMQAIARVNRVFPHKEGGLVVDYLGLGEQLKKALANYTESGGGGDGAVDIEKAIEIMLEKYEVVCAIMYGFDWSGWRAGNKESQLRLLPPAQDFVLGLPDGKVRFIEATSALFRAFSLSVPDERALAIRDDVGFFIAVSAGLQKRVLGGDGPSADDIEFGVRQLVSRAVISDEVIDIFAAAGLEKPDISILSDEFLAEVRELPQKNLAVETLRKLLEDEIRVRLRNNVVQARSFEALLAESINRYNNRAVETAIIIEELIELAKQLREAQLRGEELGLAADEVAFYDALAANESAVLELGDETLKVIAQELADKVRSSATIDWTVRESVRAKMRVMVRRLLRKYKYPPDKQEAAVDLVIQQAEALTEHWAA